MIMKQIIPHLTSSNTAVSIEFYRDLLGFKAAYIQNDDNRLPSFAIMKKDNIEIMIASQETMHEINTGMNVTNIGASVMFYVQLDSVTGYYNSIKDKVSVFKELFESDWGTTEFWIKDPDGYIFSFFK